MPSSESVKRILVVARDHGSAQAVLPVASQLDKLGLSVSLYLPTSLHPLATRINISAFNLDIPRFTLDPCSYTSSLCIYDYDLVLSGASNALNNPRPSTPEQYCISAANKLNIPSIVILDYWGMYKERFCDLGGKLDTRLVPTVICALDSRCKEDLTLLGIHPDRIFVTNNPWLDSFIYHQGDKLKTEIEDESWSIVYASQPLKQFQVLSAPHHLQHFLLQQLVIALSTGSHQQSKIFVWKHPSEDFNIWQDCSSFSNSFVSVSLISDRSPSFLSSINLFASVHSTSAFQALHIGVPCLSLRMALPLQSSYLDQIGLSHTIESLDDLYSFFDFYTPVTLRNQLSLTSADLLHRQIFFNDGRATERVVSLVHHFIR